MMGLQINKCPISLNGKSDADLNPFYKCFNVHNFREELAGFENTVLITMILVRSEQFLTTLFLA